MGTDPFLPDALRATMPSCSPIARPQHNCRQAKTWRRGNDGTGHGRKDLSAAVDRRATRPACDQLYPHAFDRCGPASQIGTSRNADGARAARLYDLEPGHAVRSARPDLAEPRPFRLVERPRLDVAVVGPASDRHARRQRRIRATWRAGSVARRYPALSPAGQP